MTLQEYRAAARALLDAEATRMQIGLLSLAHPGMTMPMPCRLNWWR